MTAVNNTIKKSGKSYLNTLLEDKEKVNQQRKIKDLKADEPLLKKGYSPLIESNALTVIQGKSGSCKSRIAQMFAGELLRKRRLGSKYGFYKTRDDIVVCYADTERNLSYQCPKAFQAILIQAGYEIDEDVEDFDFTSLVRIPRDYRFELLSLYISQLRQKHEGKYLFLILDVITDCTGSFNDATLSLELIDLINTLINEHDVSVLAVIHENPGSDKARGHLGTELMNKATTVISVSYLEEKKGVKSDVLEMKFIKNRNVSKIEPLYYYVDDKGFLEEADSDEVSELKAPNEEKAPVHEVMDILAEFLSEERLNRAVLNKVSQEIEGVSDNTIKARLQKIQNSKLKIQINNHYYILNSNLTTGGNIKSWYLEKVEIEK